MSSSVLQGPNDNRRLRVGGRRNRRSRNNSERTELESTELLHQSESSDSDSNSRETVLRKYDILSEIGEGNFGRAILVRRKTGKEQGRQFVMKKIKMSEMSDEERQGALNEVRVLQMLKHPNIIGYHEYFEDQENHELNIIMDFADQGDLFQRIQSQEGSYFEEEQILDWFVQIVLAMKHVHSQNILHRDLKVCSLSLSLTFAVCKFWFLRWHEGVEFGN